MSRKDSPEQAVQKQSAPAGVAALERGLSILRTLGQQEGLSLTEIAQRSDLNKATALRLLRTLEQQGFVWRDGRQLYYFGYALAVITRNLSMDNWLASSMYVMTAARKKPMVILRRGVSVNTRPAKG